MLGHQLTRHLARAIEHLQRGRAMRSDLHHDARMTLSVIERELHAALGAAPKHHACRWATTLVKESLDPGLLLI
jgi:hypothetical protein